MKHLWYTRFSSPVVPMLHMFKPTNLAGLNMESPGTHKKFGCNVRSTKFTWCTKLQAPSYIFPFALQTTTKFLNKPSFTIHPQNLVKKNHHMKLNFHIKFHILGGSQNDISRITAVKKHALILIDLDYQFEINRHWSSLLIKIGRWRSITTSLSNRMESESEKNMCECMSLIINN